MLTQIPRNTPRKRANSPARENFLNVIVSTPVARRCWVRVSDRRSVGFARADAHRAVDAEDEDLAVPDLTGFRSRCDGLDGLADLVGGHRHLDLHFREEGHRVFGAAIDLGVALLTPIPCHLRDGHSVHPDPDQCVADLVNLEWLDDGHDHFHGCNPPQGPALPVQDQGGYIVLSPARSLSHAVTLD